jgi:hypothetical protein
VKKWILIILITSYGSRSFGQSQEIQQLLLNWEKLTQLKEILNDMYEGYKIIDKGYTTIRDISQGNFSLHKDFLDGLLEVSPAVKKYKRIADIVNYQLRIVKGCKVAYNKFKEDNNFTLDEIKVMANVYGRLLNESVKCLDELVMVITAGELRMSDDERLEAIDKIYSKVTQQFSFLKDLNNTTAVLSVQRDKDKQELDISRKLYGIRE